MIDYYKKYKKYKKKYTLLIVYIQNKVVENKVVENKVVENKVVENKVVDIINNEYDKIKYNSNFI